MCNPNRIEFNYLDELFEICDYRVYKTSQNDNVLTTKNWHRPISLIEYDQLRSGTSLRS